MENIVRTGEIACSKQFPLFSQCFLPYFGTYFSCEMHFKMLSAICFNLDQSKILLSGNGLREKKKQKVFGPCQSVHIAHADIIKPFFVDA